ncbi:transcriptional regulator [Streptomyces azureus]|uniref:Transcriptional regulator n=1 Tax=Streptomyces azureus TaxID=146537 RepID=A0A0K8PKQ7_STRAJ|nr:transcriptional regulator [Streptomyces azureus]
MRVTGAVGQRREDLQVFNGTADSKSFKISTDGSYTYTLPSGTSAMFTTKKLSSFPSPTFS